MDDFHREPNPDPSDGNKNKPNNLDTLGFVLRTNPTGNNLVTLKARTFYRGEASRIAIITFKIATRTGNTQFYQTPR